MLLPTFINETKIAFVFLFFYLALILNTHKKMEVPVSKYVFAIVFLIISIIIYNSSQHNYNIEHFDKLTSIKDYFFDPTLRYSENFKYGVLNQNVDISRIGKIILLFTFELNNLPKIFLGIGYGIMQGQNFLGGSQIGQSLEYLWYGSQGLLFTSLIQGGIALTLVLSLAMFSFLNRKQLQFKNKRNFKILLLVVFITMFIYNQAILEPFFSIPVAYLIVWAKRSDDISISSGSIQKSIVKKF